MPQPYIFALVLVFGSASLWDGFTTVYGTSQIMGGGMIGIIAGVLVALIVLIMLSGTNVFWFQEWGSNREIQLWIFRIFWLGALCYDAYTSYLGNERFLVSEYPSGPENFVLVGMTFLVTGSPVMMSILFSLDN